MMDPEIGADWALIGAQSGDNIGYSILAASRDDIDFGQFVGRYVPGAPSADVLPGAPDALPWITFGPVAIEPDEIVITVSVRGSSHGHDHAGRSAWTETLFVMWFTDLADVDASYLNISAALLGTPTPAAGSGPLSLPISSQRAGEPRRTIESYGFENFATLAAGVLEGSVAVADADHLPREERLAVFDAVAALLPYGFRADLSVSSVVNNISNHGIRLSFAHFPNDTQQLLSLRAPTPELRTDDGRRYRDLLMEKRETSGFGALLKYLQDAKGPYSFQDPGMAIAILTDLGFDEAFKRDASRGPVPVEMLRKFVGDKEAAARSWAGFDTIIRDNVLSSYLPGRDEEAAAAVIPCWDFVGEDVVRLLNEELDRNNAELARWCLGTAGDRQDLLLARLLVPEQEVPKRRRTMLIELLGRMDPPPPNELRYTCDRLRYGTAGGRPSLLVRNLLIHELAGKQTGNRGKAWARWLCQSGVPEGWPPRPGWVAALDFGVFSTPADGALANARSLILSDPLWVGVLLRLARLSGSLRYLLDHAYQEITTQAAKLSSSAKASGTDAWLRAVLDGGLWALDVLPAAVASIDVARILLGGMPADFADPSFPELPGDYFDGLKTAFALSAVQPHLAEVEDGFLRCALPGDASAEPTAGGVMLLNAWAEDPQRRPALLDYIAGLKSSAYPYHRSLSAAFWNALSQHSELADYAAGKHLITATTEALQAPGAALWRGRTENAVLSTPLALACLNTRRAGLSVQEMIRALHHAEASRIGARRLDIVLREFQDLRYREYLDVPPDDTRLTAKEAAEAELFECYWRITNGALGIPFAAEFRTYLTGQLKIEIQVRVWLLEKILPADGKRVTLGGFSDDEQASGFRPSAGRARWLSWRPGRVRPRRSRRKGDHASRPRRGDRPSQEVT